MKKTVCFIKFYRMRITINGEIREVNSDNLKKVIESFGFDVSKVVVVLNGEILPKSKVSDTSLNENDDIEILTIMGGG